MLTLKEFIESVNYTITGGSEYGWQCFGPNARWLESEGEHYSASAVFDRKTQVVYVAEVHDTFNDRCYRMIHPEYYQEYCNEHRAKDLDPDFAYDTVEYTDLDVVEDFIEKTMAISAGENYDTRVSVPLDIPNDELLKYMIMAHERGMTFNDFVEEALRAAIAELG
jgi:hypothetical protein